MSNVITVRRGAVAAAAAGLIALSTTVAGPGVADAVTSTAPTAPAARQVPKTTLTFEVPGCEGCEVGVVQARWAKHAKYGVQVWSAKPKTVSDGEVTFRLPTRRTHGLSMTVSAPWEGATGYVTTVAFRYGGEKPGDQVRFREARKKTRASACWAGTTERTATIPLTVRKVWVQGTRHRTRGSIAYATTTQDWMVPMRQVWDGVMGSQDVNVCGKR